jgi:phenylalanyl-tRNA synthetase beta chain
MRLLLSWARDFVDVKASIEDVAEKLGLRGFEVAEIERLGADDGVIDFEVTANRPDALSVVGLAREIATAYDLPLRPPSPPHLEGGDNDRVSVTLEDTELCPRYAAAVAEVTATTSPAFMTERLHASGIRPISPFVDITNYVLMELGHPMHAFDLDTLQDHAIRVRRAKAGETLVTLDNVSRTLDPEMLVIADAVRPQAVAGVMGGAATEVSERTRAIAFESAYFKPASVRRTGKRLGLKTEASARFERGADINAPVRAIERAVELMRQIGAGRLYGPVVDRYPTAKGPKALRLRKARLSGLLGLDVPDAEVTRILRALGLEVSQSGDGWEVLAPTFRVDLTREVDLIEEVGRHYGFDKLEPAFPPVTAPPPPPDARVSRDRRVRSSLTGAGLSEAVTFGFIEAKAARLFGSETQGGLIGIANPLSGKFDTLRPSLTAGLVDAVAYNRRHGRRDVALFEIGARFTPSEGETRAVGMAWTGLRSPEHWSGGAREVDFFDIKGVVDELCRILEIDVRFEPITLPFLVPGQSAAILAGATIVGFAGLLAPDIADERGAPRQDNIFVAEIDLDRAWKLRIARSEQVQPLPRHPFVVRDLSIVVADTLPAEIIRGTIQAAGSTGRAPLVGIAFFDRYKGKGVQGGKGLADDMVSLSVHLTFQAPDRTLTDSDVQASVDQILEALVREHGAQQR